MTTSQLLFSPHPGDMANQWDKSTKSPTEVSKPSIVKIYNQFMGGIDLLGSFTDKYKFHIRSNAGICTFFGTPSSLERSVLGCN